MKRLHIHLSVDNLDHSTAFYSAMFGAEPTKQKMDYCKWQLDDPPVNFAISSRGAEVGLDHLGIQVDDATELTELRDRFTERDMTTMSEGETTCCYAQSDKTWMIDPSGIAWESYRTMADAVYYHDPVAPGSGTCCAQQSAPSEPASQCC